MQDYTASLSNLLNKVATQCLVEGKVDDLLAYGPYIIENGRQ